ncbi:ribonuclease P protein component [Patescibacteria group bacterium]
MLPRKYKLKKKTDFKKVFDKGKYYQGRFISLKILKNDLEISRFGFIVGLKISKKAVDRNRIKRRLENTVQIIQKRIKFGFDVVVMVRPEIIEKKYTEIKENLLDLFKKSGLLLS